MAIELDRARELLFREGPEVSRSVREGSEIVRQLAEQENLLEAWELILECHEKRIGPFKTNKFRREAKVAIERLKGSAEFFAEGDRLLEAELSSAPSDFAWLEKSRKRDEVLTDYLQLRSFMCDKMTPLVYKLFKKEDMTEAARRLGIGMAGRTFYFDSEEEMAILADFCVFLSRANGKIPAAAEFMNQKPPTEISELEHRVFECWRRYRYTMIKPLKYFEGFGVQCRDLLSGRDLVVVDRGMGSSMQPGLMCMATGLLPFGNCFMTTGTALPFPSETIDDVLETLLKMQGLSNDVPILLTKRQQVDFAAHTIKLALMSGMGDHVRYR